MPVYRCDAGGASVAAHEGPGAAVGEARHAHLYDMPPADEPLKMRFAICCELGEDDG